MYYSLRSSGAGLCFSSATCDTPIMNTWQPWTVYAAPTPEPTPAPTTTTTTTTITTTTTTTTTTVTTPEPTTTVMMWPQYGQSHTKCRGQGQAVTLVTLSQIECQNAAIAAGHAYYSLRHSGQGLCYSTANCF